MVGGEEMESDNEIMCVLYNAVIHTWWSAERDDVREI